MQTERTKPPDKRFRACRISPNTENITTLGWLSILWSMAGLSHGAIGTSLTPTNCGWGRAEDGGHVGMGELLI